MAAAQKTPAPDNAQLIDDPADAPTIEQYRLFHELVMEYAASINAAAERVDSAKTQLDRSKAGLKEAESDLAAFINDDKLPLLKDLGDE